MIKWILNWFGGGIIGQIGKELNQAYENKLKAQNDREKLEAQMIITELEARKTILLAEQNNGLTRWIRPAFALPFVIFVFKVVVWDTVLGLGTTPHLSSEMYDVMAIVLGAYFLTRGLEKVFKR